MRTKLGFWFAVILAALPCVQADDVGRLANLGKMPYNEASSTVDAIVAENEQLVATLAREIEQPNFPPDSKTCAIYLLGELRPKGLKAIQALVENIDFVASQREPALRIERWGMYPAQEALAKIGTPAVTVILRNYLPTEGNQLRRHLMCQVLRDVLGKEIGTLAVREELEKESKPSKKEHLQAALQQLEQ